MWAASVLIASGVFYVLYIFSQGKWIGFGDVRLGLITGTLLALAGVQFPDDILGFAAGLIDSHSRLSAGIKRRWPADYLTALF